MKRQALLEENVCLRDCLRQVQREIIESANLEKSFCGPSSEAVSQIEFLKEALFDMPFDDED